MRRSPFPARPPSPLPPGASTAPIWPWRWWTRACTCPAAHCSPDVTAARTDAGTDRSGGEQPAEFARERSRLAGLASVSPNRVRPRDERPPVDAPTATPGTLDASGEIELDTGAGHFSFRADRLPL